jgi:hypothetical protein
MKQRAYIETSVVSYAVGRRTRNLLIAARQSLTCEWWATAPQRFTLLVSPVVVRECSVGDAEMAAKRMRLIASLASPDLNNEELP